MEPNEIKAELEATHKALEEKLDAALAEHTKQVEEQGKASTELTGKVDELSGQYKEIDDKLTELAQKQAQGFSQGREERKTMGQQFIESDAFESLAKGETKSAKLEVKNTISNLTGSPEEVGDVLAPADRLSGIIPGAFRALNILDVIPQGQTSQPVVEYTQESSWTNDAAETQEKAAKPESDLEFELVTENIRTIAHFIRMSNQAMQDAPLVQSYVNNRLIHGVRARLQSQIIKGNGSSANLSGLNQTGRHTDFTPTTGDTALDSINRAKYAAIGADFMTNAVFMNPADWGAIERLKRTDDGYVAGEGSAISYISGGMIPTVWGLPVVMSNDVTEGEFFALDTNAIQLVVRQGVTIELGFINDDFQKNLTAIRVEMRAGLLVFQPLAVRYGSLTV